MILLLCLTLLLPTLALAQAPASCTHFASITGSGTACSAAQPCQVERFWALAGPGKTLCLADGVYRGASQMIIPPAGLKGTQNAPITIRATNDGGVTLDAQHAGNAVWLGWHDGVGPNDWFVVEGVNAKNGADAIYKVSSSNSTLRRVIGWDGTSRMQNSFAFDINGYGSRAEDCAGWGMNLRKVFNASQTGDQQGGGFRRCWGEWNDHTDGESYPMTTYQAGYGSRNQLWENILGTWNTLGDLSPTKEGVLSIFCGGCNPGSNSVTGTKVLGSVLYITPGASFAPEMLVWSLDSSNISMRDIAMVIPPGYPDKRPFYIFPGCTSTCTGNTCTNCLAVHDGTPGLNAPGEGWTFPGLKQGRGLAAATGGQSAFTLLPGLCRRYVGGELTATPLWPWAMNDRIKAARVQSGATPVDVTAQIEQVLGPIPAVCKGEGPPDPPIEPPIDPPTPPTGTPLTCVGVQNAEGTIAVACTPAAARSRR